LDAAAPSSDSNQVFHAYDVEQVDDYRSLSVMALFSLLLGILSFLCLFSNLFVIVPLCGIVFSLLAMRRIASSNSQLAGRGAAMTGLALCVAFGVAAYTRAGVTQHFRSGQAERYARKWLEEITANNSDPAFKMTYNGVRPLPPPEPGVPPPKTTPFQDFMANALIQKLTAAGENAKIELVETLQYKSPARSEYIVRQLYRVTPQGASDSAAGEPVEVEVTTQHSHFPGQSERHWLVVKFDPPGTITN